MNRRKFITLLAAVSVLPAGFLSALGNHDVPTSNQLKLNNDQLERLSEMLRQTTTEVWYKRYKDGLLELAGEKITA